MKILHIINELFYGGAARALMTCAHRCAQHDGSRHTIIGLAPTHNNNRNSIALAAKLGLCAIESPDYDTLCSAISANDIVHLHYWNAPPINEFMRKNLPPMRLLIKFNIGGQHPPHVITQDIVDFADMVQTTGPFANELQIFSELDPEVRLAKVHMCYGAADFSRLKNYRPKPHDSFNVSYLGTVNFIKMHPDYVYLSNSVHIPEARFIVCGFGDAYPTLKKQAQELGAMHRFDFRMEREDISTIFATTDVFGYPLCEDNYSSGELVLQEVAYAGIPAVVFTYGGAGRLVINNFTGYVVRTAPEYREAIEYLYQRPDERKRMGRNAREYAMQLFGDKNAAHKTLEMYDRLMKQLKRLRVFGQAGRIGPSVCPSLVSDSQDSENHSATGARLFVESLGSTAPWFMESLTSVGLSDQVIADERISNSTPGVSGALFAYRNYFSNDSVLCFWTGILFQRRRNEFGAAAAYLQAINHGYDHWRVYFRLAQCTIKLGEIQLTKEALLHVLQHVPNFIEAKNMMRDIMCLSDVDSSKSAETLRLRRAFFVNEGKIERAEETARMLLELKPNSIEGRDMEAYYRVGLDLHKNGHLELAVAVYRKVLEASITDPEIAAWAAFKHGELLLERGDEEGAKRLFYKALIFNPEHAKAKIYLVKPSEPLRICLGEQGHSDCIKVPMKPINEELWQYYFTRRAPDFVRMEFPMPLCEWDSPSLVKLLSKYLAPGGAAEIVMVGENNLDWVQHSNMPIIKSMGQAGLNAKLHKNMIKVQSI
jgi:glycosyltransferase involved in cell wall biosynthesis